MGSPTVFRELLFEFPDLEHTFTLIAELITKENTGVENIHDLFFLFFSEYFKSRHNRLPLFILRLLKARRWIANFS